MASFQYGNSQTPYTGRVGGFVITANFAGNTIRTMPKLRRNFSALQKSRSALLLQVSRAWSGQSPSTKLAWHNWANYYPQHTIKNPAKFITAYHNFTKRNFYQLLRNGISSPLITNPVLITYQPDPITATATVSSIALNIKITFARSANDLDCFFFISFTPFLSREIRSYYDRYMLYTRNISNTFNITAAYIARFGKLPTTKDFLHIYYLSTGRDNGQFFNKILLKIPLILPLPSINLDAYYRIWDDCVSLFNTSYTTTITAINYYNYGSHPGCGNIRSNGRTFKIFTFSIGSQLWSYNALEKNNQTFWSFNKPNRLINQYAIFHITNGIIDYIEYYNP